MARQHAPSTIFIDELESLMGNRSADGEHEGSKRLKTELLIQLDGLNQGGGDGKRIFFLAATNLPWDLDTALLRRLEKRILIDLPDVKARASLFRHYLPDKPADATSEPSFVPRVEGLVYEQLAKLTEGYSGADVSLVCKEALMRPLRKAFERMEMNGGDSNVPALDAVTQEDVEQAIQATRPSCPQNIGKKFEDWDKQFGSK
jgi:katanin p60 ATPase-containing subunit A1